jgi:hypothetical protein
MQLHWKKMMMMRTKTMMKMRKNKKKRRRRAQKSQLQRESLNHLPSQLLHLLSLPLNLKLPHNNNNQRKISHLLNLSSQLPQSLSSQ